MCLIQGGWGGLNSCVGGESEVFSKTNKRGAFNKTRGRRFILHYRQNKKVFPRYSNKSFLTFCKKTAWIIKFCYLMKWNRESILLMIIYNSDFVKLIACSLIIQICRWGLSTKSLSEMNYSIIQKKKQQQQQNLRKKMRTNMAITNRFTMQTLKLKYMHNKNAYQIQ